MIFRSRFAYSNFFPILLHGKNLLLHQIDYAIHNRIEYLFDVVPTICQSCGRFGPLELIFGWGVEK